MANRWGNSANSVRLYFFGSKITADGVCSHEIKRRLLLRRKAMTNLDSILKSRDITLPTKVRLVKTTGFSSSHVWMWKLDYKKSWVLKNWCFWTVVLKTLESPLNCKEIKPVHPKGNQSWIFIGRANAKAEIPILWPPDAKNWLIESRRRSGWQRMRWVGWHHWLDGHELSKLRESVMDREAWCAASIGLQRVGHDWVTELN